MPVAHLVLLVLALFATLLMAVGWLQDPSGLTAAEWFVAKVTEGGFWSGIFLSLLAAAFFGWRASRTSGKVNGPN